MVKIYTNRLKNSTLRGGTYLYSLYKGEGVPPREVTVSHVFPIRFCVERSQGVLHIHISTVGCKYSQTHKDQSKPFALTSTQSQTSRNLRPDLIL